LTTCPNSRIRIAMNRARLAAVLALFCANSVSATPVLYDESVDGDLPSGFDLPQLTLQTGLNIVRGETSVFATAPGVDADSFSFVVPSRMTLVSGRVDVTDSFGDMTQVRWSFQDGPFTDVSLLEQLIVSSPGSTTFTTTPLGAGTYFVIGGGFISPGGDHSSLYEFRLDVRAVPEPTSSSLFCLGVAAALSVRTRRCRSAAFKR